MKKVIAICLLTIFVASCSSQKKAASTTAKVDSSTVAKDTSAKDTTIKVVTDTSSTKK